MSRRTSWARVVAVAALLIGGFAGSAAGVRLSGYPGPPAEPVAIDVASTVIGQAPADTPSAVVVCDYWCPEYNGDNVVSYDSPADHTDVVTVTYDLPAPRDAVTAAARERLTASGWRQIPGGEYVRDNLMVDVQVSGGSAGTRATLVVAKAMSTAAIVLAIAGFLLGAPIGWLVTAAAARRYHRQDRTVRTAVAVLTVPVVLVTFAYTLSTANLAYRLSADASWRPKDVQLAEFALTVFPPLSVLVALAVLASTVLLARPPSRREPAAPALTPVSG